MTIDTKKTFKKNLISQDLVSKHNIIQNIKIGIIIPAYNEEKNIANVLSKFLDDFSNQSEIIVIDDGSTDNTAEVVKIFDVTLLTHKINKGNGAAIITGLKYCKKRHFDIVIIMDADGQHNPKYIPEFIDLILNHDYEFIIGNRFKFPYEMNSYKKLFSKLLTAFYFILFHKKISDPTNGFRALSKNVIQYLNLNSKYSITQEMLLKLIPEYKWRELPTKVNQRKNGKSFIKFRSYLFNLTFCFLRNYIFLKLQKAYKILKN